MMFETVKDGVFLVASETLPDDAQDNNSTPPEHENQFPIRAVAKNIESSVPYDSTLPHFREPEI